MAVPAFSTHPVVSHKETSPMYRILSTVAVVLLALGLAVRADDKKDGFKLEDGFTLLFNGKDLDGWEIMNKGKFEAKDGVIFLNKGGGWLRSAKEYKDFELRMDFRFMNKGADSGIFLRASKEGKNWPDKNYQVQTMDDPSICSIFPAGLPKKTEKKDKDLLKKVYKPLMEWQSYVITALGPKLEVKLNGELITVADGLADQAGFIGLQGEGGLLEFKNIRIKELKADGK
jgi:hypothetical protein